MKPNTYFKIENENQLISLFDDHKTDFYVQDFDQLHERFTDGYHYAVKDNTGKIRLATHKVGVEVDNPYQEKNIETVSLYDEDINEVKSLISLCGFEVNLRTIYVIEKAFLMVNDESKSITDIANFIEKHKK